MKVDINGKVLEDETTEIVVTDDISIENDQHMGKAILWIHGVDSLFDLEDAIALRKGLDMAIDEYNFFDEVGDA